MILLDTNVVSEPLRPQPSETVLAWLVEHDAQLALPSVAIAEVAFGIEKIRPEQRATRLAKGLDEWRSRFPIGSSLSPRTQPWPPGLPF